MNTHDAPQLAATSAASGRLRQLMDVAIEALNLGAVDRGGAIPQGGPDQVALAVRDAIGTGLPLEGVGSETALRSVVRMFAALSVDPADPLCCAHLHVAPLDVAVAADVAVNVLNPSQDSWDQAPAGTALERILTGSLARLVFPANRRPDAVVTTGATESNLVAMLLARERTTPGRSLTLICSTDAHHSVSRAAWILGLAPPRLVPTTHRGALDHAQLERVLAASPGPHVVVATAGSTDHGAIDPLEEIAAVTHLHGAHLHVDAAYGGGLLFSERRRKALQGIESADTVSMDLHKFGWQPLAAGLLVVADAEQFDPLRLVADYLNAQDDQEAGLPDVLGRSIRTSRRPDILKVAVTFQALGRNGVGRLVDRCCDLAGELAELVSQHPELRLWAAPELSTVLFRPIAADRLLPEAGDRLVADIRRRLLHDGRVVLGRAAAPDRDGERRLWLKVTLLNPEIARYHLEQILHEVEAATALAAPV
jgi:L-2,4-diaminobutyrate decarboxylase